MEITILGSGAWEGIPVPFCHCRVCKSAKSSSSKDNRTRPEILVESDDGKFLIEISPDIRVQSSTYNLPVIKDFLISHWHFDHLYGLYELHAWSEFVLNKELNLFCSQKTNKWLDIHFKHIPKNSILVKPFVTFYLYEVEVTPFPLYHMSEDEKKTDEQLENAFGFVLNHDGRKVVYLADYYKLPQKSIDLIKNADVVIADGTYLFEEYFPNKTAQNELKSDPDHLHDKEILDFVTSLNAKKVIFHSISHLSEKTHDELQELLPVNMFISYDGMKL